MSLFLLGFGAPLAQFSNVISTVGITGLVLIGAALRARCSRPGSRLRFIPNNSVGVVEKLWSAKGSVPEGQIIALNGEAGFQADLLRGGIHFGYWRWQYRVHKVPLVTIPQGKIGYVYARDGEPLPPSQTLGRVVAVQQLPGRPRVPRSGRRRGRRRASAASAAGSARSCAKACTPSTRPCSSSSPKTHVYRAAAHADRAGARDDRERGSDELPAIDGFDPVVDRRARSRRADPLDPDEPMHGRLASAS